VQNGKTTASGELGGIRKEAVVAYFRICRKIYVEGLDEL
jgi:hypothetical protein